MCQPISNGGLGIPSLLVRHEALLARHVVRLFRSLDSLWTSMMRARYGPLSIVFVDNVRLPRRCSSIWREMMIRADPIIQHMRWIVDDGRLINFMTDY